MAAPAGIVWGSAVNDHAKIGIYVSKTSDNTSTTINVEVWVWSKYSIHDPSTYLYFDDLSSSGSASTSVGTYNVHTDSDSGGWSESNQQKLYSYSHKYSRATSASTRYLYAKLTNVWSSSGSVKPTASTTVSIPALDKYTISYNANGGSGAPGNQTKYYGINLTISSTKPTRTGHSFEGWSLTNGGSVYYTPGSECGKNENLTLYAVWTPNTYTVSYNANGGDLGRVPIQETKTYGKTLQLSSEIPTRTNYNFKGWATSASASTPAYVAGGNYTANSAATLYAVWELAYVKPRISELVVARCLQNGTTSDDGTYARVQFKWACDRTISSITVRWVDSAGVASTASVAASGTSGSVNQIVGGGLLDVEKTYAIEITVRDAVDYSYTRVTLPSRNFTIDCLAGGNGIAFGKAAERSGFADFGFNVVFNGSVEGNAFGLGVLPQIGENEDFNTYLTPGVYGIGAHATAGTVENNPAGAQAGRLIVCAATGGNVGIQYWSYIQQWYIPMSFEASKQNAIYVRTITRSPNSAPNYYAWLKFTAVSV